MSEIKNIVFTKMPQGFIKRFASFINYLIPLKIKFQNETFCAINQNKIQGSITLDKDSKSTTRFKITNLFLEENSTSVALELINYIMTRYSAMGASAFYVVIDEKQTDLLNIFKNELNYRFCGLEYLFKINLPNCENTIFLKPFKKTFIKEITKFYNENINSFNRFLFSRQEYQFLNNCQKFIFYNEDKNELLGYFEVATKNKIDFYINFSIDVTYNTYLIDAIKYIISNLKHKNKEFNLYIKVKNYFMNSKELITILKENNSELISTGHVFAKDYYKEIKENNLLKNARIMFNDPTIA